MGLVHAVQVKLKTFSAPSHQFCVRWWEMSASVNMLLATPSFLFLDLPVQYYNVLLYIILCVCLWDFRSLGDDTCCMLACIQLTIFIIVTSLLITNSIQINHNIHILDCAWRWFVIHEDISWDIFIKKQHLTASIVLRLPTGKDLYKDIATKPGSMWSMKITNISVWWYCVV